MMRFECSQLVLERLDPLVEPGIAPSAHMHQIAGGNSFNTTMTPITYDPSKESTCTTCTYSEDFSNYWTASLYFKARNGSFHRVPQATNLGLKGKNGGLTVYYIPPYDGKTKVTAPPPVSNPRHYQDSSNKATGIPYASWKPNAPIWYWRTKRPLPPLRGQHCTEPIRWSSMHR